MKRGDVYDACLSPTEGSKPAGTRPVVIVSRDAINQYSSVIVIVPLTKAVNVKRSYPNNVAIPADEGGLTLDSVDMGRERPLQDVYTAVELLDKPEAYRHLDRAALQQKAATEKRIDGLLLARQEKRLFVQGGPGVGKTTLLKHLALESAHPQGKLPFVPVFVDLQMLADADKNLFDFVVAEFSIGGFSDAAPYVERYIQDARLLLLLDGLDELPVVDGQRKRVEKRIEQTEYVFTWSECYYFGFFHRGLGNNPL